MLLFRDLIPNMAKGAKIFNQVEKILVIWQVSSQSGPMVEDHKAITNPDWFLRNRVPKFDSKLALACEGMIICARILLLRKEE
jgi:hypothetical protein